MKKIISILLCVFMMMSLSVIAFAEENNIKKAYITNIGVNTIAKRMI